MTGSDKCSLCNFGVFTCDCTSVEATRDSEIETQQLTLHVDAAENLAASEEWVMSAPTISAHCRFCNYEYSTVMKDETTAHFFEHG